MTFVSEEDRAAREAAMKIAADTVEADVDLAASQRLPEALQTIKRDYRSGMTKCVVTAASWGNLVAWSIAKRLSVLITEETGFPAEPNSNAVDKVHEVLVTLPN